MSIVEYSPDGQQFALNEPMSMFAKQVMCDVGKRMRRIVDIKATKNRQKSTPGIEKVFSEYYKNLIQAMANEFGKKVSINVRNVKYSYKIFCGYNTVGHGGNPLLKHIVHRYAKNRYYGVEIKGKAPNELMAMLMSVCDEMSDLFPSRDCGYGLWALPIVHLVNYHIMAYTDLPPVRVGRTRADDDPLVEVRDNDTWIATAGETDHPTFPDNKPIAAEERDDVRDRLKKFIDSWTPIIPASQPDEELIGDEDAAAAACDTI